MITQMLQITRFSGIDLSSNSRNECSVKLRNDDGTFRDGKFSHFLSAEEIELMSFDRLIKVNRQLMSHLLLAQHKNKLLEWS
jgi:hypothetical protein